MQDSHLYIQYDQYKNFWHKIIHIKDTHKGNTGTILVEKIINDVYFKQFFQTFNIFISMHLFNDRKILF